jgi:hypothetical protein
MAAHELPVVAVSRRNPTGMPPALHHTAVAGAAAPVLAAFKSLTVKKPLVNPTIAYFCKKFRFHLKNC